MRLGCYVVCIAGAVACAQGVPSPGTEELTDDGGAGRFTSAGSGVGGSIGSAGGFAQGGSIVGVGSGGKGGAGGGGKGGGATGGGSSAGSSAGGGTGQQGCAHPQPGAMGMTVQYKNIAPELSVPYIYFGVQVDNPDENEVALADLHVRYYFANDLTAPSTDFYSPQIKKTNGVTENVSAGDLKATYTETYLEVSFTSAQTLKTGENVSFQVHANSNPVKNHDQTNDYSFSPSTTLTLACHVVLYQQAVLAWGTPP